MDETRSADTEHNEPHNDEHNDGNNDVTTNGNNSDDNNNHNRHDNDRDWAKNDTSHTTRYMHGATNVQLCFVIVPIVLMNPTAPVCQI